MPAPTGLTATKGTYPDRIRLEWKPVEGAVAYRYYRSPVEAPAEVRPFTADRPPWNNLSVLPGVEYRYRISAVAATGETSELSEVNTGYAGTKSDVVAPRLTAPADGATLNSFEPTLRWLNPPKTTQVQLQLLPFNGDGPGADLYIGSAATSFLLPPPPEWYGLLPDMTYSWRVRTSKASAYAGPDDPSWGPWTKASFRTPDVSSEMTQVSPAPGSTVQTRTPTLQWTPTDPNVWYFEIRISKDPGFANAFVYGELIHGGVTNPKNSYTVPAAYPLEPDTLYYWQVRPRVQGDARQIEQERGERRRLALVWSLLYTFRTGVETPSPILFTVPPVLPPGIVGVPYRYSFCDPDPGAPGIASPELCRPEYLRPGNPANNPRGGHEPYHFQKETGSQFWPLGLTLNTNGVLDGIPSAPGTRVFTICAIDLDAHERCAPTALTILPAPERLPAPTGLTATRCTYPDRIHITRNAVPKAAQYRLYRNTLNSTVSAVAVAEGNALQYDDYAIAVGTTYYYWIKAVGRSRRRERLQRGCQRTGVCAAHIATATTYHQPVSL